MTSSSVLLIVDDEIINLKVLAKVLDETYTLLFARTGEEALKLAQNEPQPDLILSDIIMPGIDGFELCAQLKAQTRTKDIPVVFLTAQSEESEEAKGLALGAIDYIRKPFSPPIIRARIHNHLELKKNRDMLANLSNIDGLTGIPNRRSFDAVFENECSRMQRSQNPLSTLFIDIDNFKNYNDHYGHLKGDSCLRKVALALQRTLSRPADFVARYGGEEFVILLPDTEQEGCQYMAQKVLKAVDRLQIEHIAASVGTHVTISVGALTCQNTAQATNILDEVDRQLYQAKQAGRHRVSFILLH